LAALSSLYTAALSLHDALPIFYHGGGICGVLITVLLSLYLRNVWALAIGFAAEAAAACLLSHLLCPFRPRLRIDRSPAGELLRLDRKSTRLNSSHVVTSYAVFC